MFDMPADLGSVASALCAAKSWEVAEDLTETVTGAATPVLQVITEHGPAVLRIGVHNDALQAYRQFSMSGVTPALFADGLIDDVSWALVEWIEGTSLLPAETGRTEDLVDVVCRTSIEVLATIRKLHTNPAPAGAQVAAVERARHSELHILTSTNFDGTPHLQQITRELWAPAVLLHGDLLVNNVLKQHDGSLRIIDPAGGYGPAEADAGSWAAMICALTRRLDTVRSYADIFRLAGDHVERILLGAPWLDRRRLYGWTAVALCKFAMQEQQHGEPAGMFTGLIAIAAELEKHGRGPYKSPGTVTPNSPCSCGSGKKFKRCCGNPATRM